MLNYFELYDAAYALTEHVTPRSFDCGNLCNAVCCGNLSHSIHLSGMSLLPYEKEYLEHIGADGFQYQSCEDGYILTCSGTCQRRFRPFSCRIFPYYPCFSQSRIKLKKDIRAAQVCPLLISDVSKRLNIYFIRNVKRAVRILSNAPEIKADIIKTADFIDSLYELYSKIN